MKLSATLRGLALACLTMLAATAAQAKIEITDVIGRTVILAEPAQRVVLGFYFEDFLAVVGPGAMDRVVGLSLTPWRDWRPRQFEAYSAVMPSIANLPDVGDTENNTFSIEKVISLKPDLVILAAWSYSALGESVQQIERAEIPILVIDYNAQTLEKHVQSTLALGKAMGSEQRAEQLVAQYKASSDDTRARIEKAGPSDKKIYVELAKQGPSEVGNSYGNGMWGGVIDNLGGINIAKGKIENWGPLSPEYVLTQQPDVVFLAGSEWVNAPEAVLVGFGADKTVAQERAAAYLTRPGWTGLPAVKTGNVHAIYHGGARTLSDFVYSRYIAKTIYPEAFADVDPATEIQQYYETWLPIKADGIFVMRVGTAGH